VKPCWHCLCHYIFNLHYSINKLIHQFAQQFLLGINDDDRKIPPKLRSLINKINIVLGLLSVTKVLIT